MRWLRIGIFSAVFTAAMPVALGDRAETSRPWAEATKPASGPSRSIGGYSAGCVQGAIRLPDRGPGFQVAEPERGRHFGHPALISTIRDLGSAVRKRGQGVLLIGDLGQPRGGPTPSGHSSHQSGLDADIWYWHPRRASKRRLSRTELAKLSAPAIVSVEKRKRSRYWSPKVAAVLRLATEDERVSRIFVNPVIKRELCRQIPEKDRGWLHKLRPWWGHAAHFHVRLHCPEGSPDCEPQAPIAAGDGCAEVDWWLSERAAKDRSEGRERYRSTIREAPELPAACEELVAR